MKRSSEAQRDQTEMKTAVCTWCKKPFVSKAEKELHVSLLGAPGEFHRVCYEEYRLTMPAGP